VHNITSKHPSSQVLSLPKDEFPSLDDVLQADLVILGGGKYSANGEEPWIKKLLQCLPAWVATGAVLIHAAQPIGEPMPKQAGLTYMGLSRIGCIGQ